MSLYWWDFFPSVHWTWFSTEAHRHTQIFMKISLALNGIIGIIWVDFFFLQEDSFRLLYISILLYSLVWAKSLVVDWSRWTLELYNKVLVISVFVKYLTRQLGASLWTMLIITLCAAIFVKFVWLNSAYKLTVTIVRDINFYQGRSVTACY